MVELKQHGENSTTATVKDLTTKMSQILTQNYTQTLTTIYDTTIAQTKIKLDGKNYALWSQVVEMYIIGIDRLGYINGDLPQPEPTDPTFR